MQTLDRAVTLTDIQLLGLDSFPSLEIYSNDDDSHLWQLTDEDYGRTVLGDMGGVLAYVTADGAPAEFEPTFGHAIARLGILGVVNGHSFAVNEQNSAYMQRVIIPALQEVVGQTDDVINMDAAQFETRFVEQMNNHYSIWAPDTARPRVVT